MVGNKCAPVKLATKSKVHNSGVRFFQFGLRAALSRLTVENVISGPVVRPTRNVLGSISLLFLSLSLASYELEMEERTSRSYNNAIDNKHARARARASESRFSREVGQRHAR